MKTKYNRFAIIPCLCASCKEYIFLEKYRRSDVFTFHGFTKQNICKECIIKFDVGNKKEVQMESK